MSKRNENRPGYKKTKVGWIPEEWTPVKLGNCFKLASGETKPSIISEYPNNKENVPVYGGNGILGYTSQVFGDCKRIIIGRVGEKCGCVHLVKGPHFITDNALYTKAWLIDVSIEYFAYFLDYFKLSRLRNKGGQPLVSQKPIYAVTIPLPPLPEQKKIAEILSAWDRAIEQVGKLIDAKQRLKKGLMQQLLTGRMRFSEFGKPVREKGELPEGWKESKIGQLFKRVTRKNNTGVEHVLTASGEHGLVDQRDYFNRSVASKSLDGYYHLKRGEYAYNRSAMQGYPYGAIKRLNDYPEGVLSTLYLCFALSSQENYSDFFMHYFEAGLLNRQLRGIVQVGARAHGLLNVTTGYFFALKMPVPSFREQEQIASVLNACDREIRLLKKKQEKLKVQKKGLMQKLLAGEVRVKI